MSNIFDALQRAEAENAGVEGPGLALATELLRSAEQKMRGSALNAGQQPSVDAFDAHPPAPATEDMERCPVLPVSIRQESRLVSIAEEGSLGAEKFRFLAVRLRQLRQNRPLKKILITSTIPQEGKSTVAANLADEASLGAEKFRFLAVRLRQLRQNRPLKKILITSTIPQEGKSTVAANL